MLSVLVVHKTGDQKLGRGYFELAKRLGRNVSDPDALQIGELNRVWEYQRNAGRSH